MKYFNQIEVIFLSGYSPNGLREKQLVKWLGTTAQTVIGQQNEKVKKLNLRTFKDTPPIYMS